jgi:hypothetical protein
MDILYWSKSFGMILFKMPKPRDIFSGITLAAKPIYYKPKVYMT